MKGKSIFPALLLVFLAVMGLAHLGITAHPEAGNSRWVHTDRPVPEPPKKVVTFKKFTDTVLTSGFRITHNLIQIVPGSDRGRTDLKSALRAVNTPVFDSIVKVSYQNRVIMRNTSIKALARESDSNREFWNFAGMNEFTVDLIHSTEEFLHCRFSYRNSLSNETRDFMLTVDRSGKTRIERV